MPNTSLQPMELATLFHNQMQHFQDLKDNHGIDFKMSPESVYKLIETAYSGSLQIGAFSFQAVSDNPKPFKYLTSVRRSPKVPPEKDPKCSVAPEFENVEFGSVEEVELVMTSYAPQLHNIPLMITKTMVEDLRTSAESFDFCEALGQELKRNLDFIAGKMAFEASEAFPCIEFDTDPSFLTAEDRKIVEEVLEAQLSPEARKTLAALISPTDSYIHRAQEISQIIERAGDAMFTEFYRGGVSRLITSPDVSAYTKLNAGFTTHGAQARIGAYVTGELYGIPVIKITSHIVPESYALCVWKNDQNEIDANIAFVTKVPFFYDVDTGTFNVLGDYKVLSPQYIRRAHLVNLRGM